MLPRSKALEVLQITQNIIALLPNTFPSKDQVILLLPMYRKTGSSVFVDTLHHLGHKISYSETFAADNWNEWSQYQSNLILPNFISCVQQHLCHAILTRKINLSGVLVIHSMYNKL